MISILIYCHDEKHMEEIHELCKYNTVLMGNEELAVLKYSGDESPSEAASRESTSIDLVFYEIFRQAAPYPLSFNVPSTFSPVKRFRPCTFDTIFSSVVSFK